MSIYTDSYTEDILKNANTSLSKIFSELDKKNKKILDVGCASGYFGGFIKKTTGAKVFGIEVDKDDVCKARKVLDKVYDINIEEKLDAEELGSDYDCVIFADVLEHTKNPEVILKKTWSLLKDKGQLLISFPNITHQSTILEVISGEWNLEKSGIHDETHLRYFDKNGLIKIIQDAGFTIKKIDSTILDLPKNKILETLSSRNIEANEGIIKILKQPSATAFQYIISAQKIQKQKLWPTVKTSQLKPVSSWINEWEKIYNHYNELQRDYKELCIDNVNKKAIIELQRQELSKIHFSKLWKLLYIYKKTMQYIKNFTKLLIPLTYRKKLKNYLSKYKPEVKDSISNDLLAELQEFTPKDKQQHKDILNFSVIAWDYRFQRPQHLANEISKLGNRIFYIQNEFIPSSSKNNPPIKIEKRNDNSVYIVTLCASQNLFIYQDKISEFDKEIIFASIKKLIKLANITNPIAKIDHPFWSQLYDIISMPTIYDCMDNHTAFNNTSDIMNQLETKSILESNATVVTSDYLSKFVKKENKEVLLQIIKNGCEFDLFNKVVTKKLDRPADMPKGKKIVGYYGALAEWFDLEILQDILVKHSDKNIVLIGQVDNLEITKLAKKYTNLFLLGEKPYVEIPNYLQYFDVCLIPFKLTELIKATHPVKLFEYLSSGKPVVATKLPEVTNTKSVYFSDISNFSKNIQKAINEDNKQKAQERILIGKNNTWKDLAHKYNTFLNTTFFPKISIVIVSYNSPHLIEKCLNSIFSLSEYQNLEVIIVDNNSSQETKQIIQKYKKKYNNIVTVYNKNNKGFAPANNQGIKLATGDYLMLLNNDTIMTPGSISRLLYQVDQDQVGLVGPVTNSIGNEAKINIDYDVEKIDSLFAASRNYTLTNFGVSFNISCLAAYCWLFSKKTFNKVGLLDEKYELGMFEDDDYCIRIKNKNLKIVCVEDAFVHHFGGASFRQIENQEYQRIFNKNKTYFETKWKTKWVPHKYRDGVN